MLEYLKYLKDELLASQPDPSQPNPKHKKNIRYSRKVVLLESKHNKQLKEQNINIQHNNVYKKIESQGIGALSNIELMTNLFINNQESICTDIAKRVLLQIAKNPLNLNLSALEKIPNLKFSQSISILSAVELGRRIHKPNPKTLNTPQEIYQCIAHYADSQENLLAINLNGACEMLSIRLITRGTVERSLLHPRDVFSYAVREQASSIIIAHNHPTGDLQPSTEDLEGTKRLIKAGEILGIEVIDHIIFSETSFFSLAENKFLKNL